jgi:hypothetical protein
MLFTAGSPVAFSLFYEEWFVGEVEVGRADKENRSTHFS